MRRFVPWLLLGILGLVTGLGLGLSPLTSSAPTDSEAGARAVKVPASPGCSTSTAVAPAISSVVPSFVSGSPMPFGVAIDASNKRAFVGGDSGVIDVYSLGSGPPKILRSDAFPAAEMGMGVLAGVALSPNHRYLVGASGSGAEVLDARALARSGSTASSWVTGTLQSSGRSAIEVAVSPDGTYVFVTLEDSDEMAVFNLKQALQTGFGASDLVGTVPLGGAPVGIAISPDGMYLYATSEIGAGTSNANVGTLTTINVRKAEHHPARSVISTVPAGCQPVRVVADDTDVFVTARGSDDVLAFNANDLRTDSAAALRDVVQVGEAPVGLALVNRDHSLIVADSNRISAPGASANLAWIEVSRRGIMTLKGYLPSGLFPRDMTVTPNGLTVLVANFDSDQIESFNVGKLAKGR